MTEAEGWTGLFSSAFAQSRNAMTLVDEYRRHVDVNAAYLRIVARGREDLVGKPIWEFVVGGPIYTAAEWAAALTGREFTGTTDLLCGDGSTVSVQWGATVETIDDRQLVLFVALNTSRWGSHFRRSTNSAAEGQELSAREHEVVRLVALGSSSPEIADELSISHHTVRTHVRNAMTKVGARSRAHLVAMLIGHGHVRE